MKFRKGDKMQLKDGPGKVGTVIAVARLGAPWGAEMANVKKWNSGETKFIEQSKLCRVNNNVT